MLIIALLVGLAVMLPAPAASAQPAVADSVAGVLSVHTTLPGYEVYLNGTLAGPSPIVDYRLAPGSYRIDILHDASNSWMHANWSDSIRVSAGDTIQISAILQRPYTIRSVPFDAEVYWKEEFLGTTPLIIEIPDSTRRVLRVVKPGFLPAEVQCSPDGGQFISVDLREDVEAKAQIDALNQRLASRQSRDRRRAAYLAGIGLASGAAAMLLKNTADQRYEHYQRAGSQGEMDRLFADTERFDLYSSVAFGAAQVSLALSFYYFLKSAR